MTHRILHVITSLGGGGTENYLHQIISRSPSTWSHDVVYLGRDGVNGQRIREKGVPVQKIRSPRRFLNQIKELRPDVLHTCLFWAHQIGRWAGRRTPGIKILSSHQSIDIWQRPWHRTLDYWTLPWCDCVAVNSSAAEDLIRRRLRGRHHTPEIVRVDNGLDFERFMPGDPVQARRTLGLPEQGLIGGTLIRLHPEKGAEKIPAFAEQLLAKHPQLHLAIGGVGPLERRLREETRRWGDRIHWLGWQDDTVRFLSSLDFFWLLSREESFPQALLEAAGMGLPWIAPDIGGIKDLADIVAGGGLLFPSREWLVSGSLCDDLLAHLHERRSAARQAIPRLQSHYSEAHMAQTFYAVLDQLVRRGSDPMSRPGVRPLGVV